MLHPSSHLVNAMGFKEQSDAQLRATLNIPLDWCPFCTTLCTQLLMATTVNGLAAVYRCSCACTAHAPHQRNALTQSHHCAFFGARSPPQVFQSTSCIPAAASDGCMGPPRQFAFGRVHCDRSYVFMCLFDGYGGPHAAAFFAECAGQVGTCSGWVEIMSI